MPLVALRSFADALRARDGALRRTASGKWIIRGSRGSIAAVAGGFAISFDSATPWRFALATMDFAEVVRDDGESGVMFMARHANEREAMTLRARLGIAKQTYSRPHFAATNAAQTRRPLQGT